MNLENTLKLINDLSRHSAENGLELHTAAETLHLYSQSQVMILEKMMILEEENKKLKDTIERLSIP